MAITLGIQTANINHAALGISVRIYAGVKACFRAYSE